MKPIKSSIKQCKANKLNSLKGGVKTDSGKAISSKNAISHGLLSKNLLPEDEEEFLRIKTELEHELLPESVLERVILSRICLHITQLHKVTFTKTEYIKSKQNQGSYYDPLADLIDAHVEVLEEPYKPKYEEEWVDTLFTLYHRYEVSIENRLYKAIREYKLLKVS